MMMAANARRVVLGLLLMLYGLGQAGPPPHVIMQRKMLLGIKQRAESAESTTRRSNATTSPFSLLSTMPLRFESNVGQADARVDSVARGDGYTLYLAGGNAVLTVASPAASRTHGRRSLGITLVGGKAQPESTHIGAQPGVTNYLIGPDRSKWRTGVRSYSTVKYEQVYPGVDLLFYGNPRHLEHDFVVAPGADPSVIALEFEGADGMRLDDSGDLLLRVGDADVRQKRPIMYQQMTDGQRKTIDGRYLVDGATVRFEVGEYDTALPLVIDPVTLIYSTYLGGTAAEAAVDVASDGLGSAYILGLSESLDYPAANAMQPTHAGGTRAPVPWEPAWMSDNIDLVLSKLTPDGQAFVYSTYLGGTGNDSAFAIAANASGEAFIGGSLPGGLPPAPGYEHNCPCPGGIYVAKLNASGTDFVYIAKFNSFGGSDLGVDAAGNAVVASGTILKLNPEGTALVYATAVGGGVTALAVAADGAAAVTGFTNSISFPTVAPFQEALHGVYDAFAAGLAPDGTIRFSTYLGGLLDDRGTGVTIDGAGSVYVTGTTKSLDFPTYNAIQRLPGGNGTEDMFVTKISSTGGLLYSTYLGGGYPDMGIDIVADARGRVYVLGRTAYDQIGGAPFHGGYYENYDSNWDMSVTKLDPSGGMLHSARFGGPRNDQPAAMVLGPDDSLYIGGTTYGGFPLKDPLRNMSLSVITHGGFPRSVDMFLSRLALQMDVTSALPAAVAAGNPARITITGHEFAGVMRVLIGGQWATGVVVNSATSMSLMVPALPAGFYDIVVINSEDERASLPSGLMYGTCSFVMPDALQAFSAAGGTRTIPITAVAPHCAWNAYGNADWISVQPGDGLGSSSVRFTVAPNRTNRGRSGTLTIADRAISITQARWTDPDLNGDGRVDLLWQHQTEGWLATWLMNPYVGSVEGSLLSPAQVADLAWKVVGTGDFNGDGQLDVVWQHVGDGRIAVWLMNGLTLSAGLPFTPAQVVDIDWRIRAVGDLNGDGHPDLIWQHQRDGRVAVWFMDGLQLYEGRLLNPSVVADTDWWIVGAADFNHDGRLDLVWEHQTDGSLAIWDMDGPTLISGRVYPRIDTHPAVEIKIRAVGDFNGDGDPDLMAQHVSGPDLRFCKNSNVGSGQFIFRCTFAPTPDSVLDTNWRIVGPR